MANESVNLLKGKIDVAIVLDVLNAALAEAWLAYYQYWIAAKTVEGYERTELAALFRRHGGDELSHASQLADRIRELNGVPLTSPAEWIAKAHCVYEAPTSFDSEYILKWLMSTQECAMQRYGHLVNMTEDRDVITNTLARKILSEEADQEQDLQNYLDDFATMRGQLPDHDDE